MLITPTVSQINGIVSINFTASFVGDATDATDKQRILAYGDPLIDLAGTFTDPNDNTFSFNTGLSTYPVGLTTVANTKVTRFFKTAPTTPVGQAPYVQQPLDVITSDPVRAATLYNTLIGNRITTAIATLRALTPPQLTSLPTKTV